MVGNGAKDVSPSSIFSPDRDVLADTSLCSQFSADQTWKESIWIPTSRRRTALDLVHPVVDPEKIMRKNMVGPSTVSLTENVGEVRPTWRDENTFKVIPTLGQVLAVAKDAGGGKKSSASRSQFQKEQSLDRFAPVTGVPEIAGQAINMALEK